MLKTLFFLSQIFFVSSNLLAGNMHVTFLNPAVKGDPFFNRLINIMQASAEDLNIDLEIIYCNNNHIQIAAKAKMVLQRDKHPDYLLLINEKNTAEKIMQAANALGIKVFLFNEGLHDNEGPAAAKPRTTYANWIGQLLPDDRQSGYLLAKLLIQQALAKNLLSKTGKLHIAAITGARETPSASIRVLGLKDAINEHPQAVLQQTIYAYWATNKAKFAAKGLLNRYPDTTILWSASDGIAEGAAQGITELGLKPGHDVLTGGIDWTDLGIQRVDEEVFTASIGGHVMDGAWTLLMLYDHHNGIDFSPSTKSKFFALSKENIDRYKNNILNEDGWRKIDFKKFSKTHNPKLRQYNFTLDEVLRQLK